MSYSSPLEARIAKKVTKAITEYNLIEDGDRVMVGLSGGKDSWALIRILDVLRKRAPISFSIVAVTVDSGYEGFRHDLIALRRRTPSLFTGRPEEVSWDAEARRFSMRRGDHLVLVNLGADAWSVDGLDRVVLAWDDPGSEADAVVVPPHSVVIGVTWAAVAG